MANNESPKAVPSPAIVHVLDRGGFTPVYRPILADSGIGIVYLTEAQILAGIPEDPENGIIRGV